LKSELVNIGQQMSDLVSICETLLPQLTDDDQDRAKAAVNDRSAAVER